MAAVKPAGPLPTIRHLMCSIVVLFFELIFSVLLCSLPLAAVSAAPRLGASVTVLCRIVRVRATGRAARPSSRSVPNGCPGLPTSGRFARRTPLCRTVRGLSRVPFCRSAPLARRTAAPRRAPRGSRPPRSTRALLPCGRMRRRSRRHRRERCAHILPMRSRLPLSAAPAAYARVVSLRQVHGGRALFEMYLPISASALSSPPAPRVA